MLIKIFNFCILWQSSREAAKVWEFPYLISYNFFNTSPTPAICCVALHSHADYNGKLRVALHKISRRNVFFSLFAYHVNRPTSAQTLASVDILLVSVYIRKGKMRNKVNKVMIASAVSDSNHITGQRRRRRAFNNLELYILESRSNNQQTGLHTGSRQTLTNFLYTENKVRAELQSRWLSRRHLFRDNDDDARRVRRLVSITLWSSIKVGNCWKLNDFSTLPLFTSMNNSMDHFGVFFQWYHRAHSHNRRYYRHHHNHHRVESARVDDKKKKWYLKKFEIC